MKKLTYDELVNLWNNLYDTSAQISWLEDTNSVVENYILYGKLKELKALIEKTINDMEGK